MPLEGSSRDRLVRIVGVGLWLIALAAVGLPRALGRHFHVDEAQIAYDTALLGVHGRPDLATGTAPLLVAAGWLLRHLESAVSMFAALRLIFFVVFVGNLVAIAWAQPYFPSARGRLAVLAAATLFHPLWFNGFEIRMDVIAVGGSLVLYGLTQRAATGVAVPARLFFVGGLCCATMQNHSTKSLAYWIPFGVALVVVGTWRAWSSGRPRLRPALWFAVGVFAGAGLNLAIVLHGGGQALWIRGLTGFATGLASTARFTATAELGRLVLEAPVVFALAAVHVGSVVAAAARGKLAPASVITFGFLTWTLVVLYVNPAPFAYNFIHVLPFAFLAALDAMHRMSGRRRRPAASVAVAGVWLVVFARGWMFDPFLTRTNEAQLSYIRAAEALTAPDDTVLDGVGLVLSRKPPHKDWFLHSLRMARYRSGELQTFARMMLERPSPVVIDNYRWLWLSAEDRETRDARYVRIAPRLHVLGQQLDSTAGDLHIHYRGRYRVLHGAPVRIDDVLVPHGGTIELDAGRHRYTRGGDEPAVVHWLGPAEAAASDALGQIMSLGPAEALFTNEPLLMRQ